MLRVARQVRELVRVGLHVVQFDCALAVTNQCPAVGTQQMIVAAAKAVDRFVHNVLWVIDRLGQTFTLHVFRFGQVA